MLDENALNQILDSKEELVNFVTAAFVQSIAVAVDKVRDPNTSLSAAASLIDALRKARSDLLGVSADVAMPQMMVNIQFSGESPSGSAQLSAAPVSVRDMSASLVGQIDEVVVGGNGGE